MRAVICVEPGKLALIERPPPDEVPGLVPVDIRAIGICGTDFHIFEGTHPFLEYPRVMGHELSGTVAAGSVTNRRASATVARPASMPMPLASMRAMIRGASSSPRLTDT